MALDRQVQRRVSRMQVPQPGRPVGQPPDRHCPEHRLQRARVAGLNPPAPGPLIADHLINALLAEGPQRQMVSQQPAQQLPPVPVKTLLQLGMREPGGVGSVQKAHQRRELLTAGREPGRVHRIAARADTSVLTPGCSIAARLPAGQDFAARGVKFATTGVEIGGHVGHLRGRRWT